MAIFKSATVGKVTIPLMYDPMNCSHFFILSCEGGRGLFQGYMFGNEGKETITEDVKSLIFYFQQLPAYSSASLLFLPSFATFPKY